MAARGLPDTGPFTIDPLHYTAEEESAPIDHSRYHPSRSSDPSIAGSSLYRTFTLAQIFRIKPLFHFPISIAIRLTVATHNHKRASRCCCLINSIQTHTHTHTQILVDHLTGTPSDSGCRSSTPFHNERVWYISHITDHGPQKGGYSRTTTFCTWTIFSLSTASLSPFANQFHHEKPNGVYFTITVRYGFTLRQGIIVYAHTYTHTGLRETALLVTIIAPRHHIHGVVACDGNYIKAAAKPNVTKCQASKSRRWFDCVMSFCSDLFAVTLISTYSGHESARSACGRIIWHYFRSVSVSQLINLVTALDLYQCNSCNS